MLKFCKKCNTEKPLSEFHPDARRREGFSDKCKSCQAILRREQKLRAGKMIYYTRHGSERHANYRATWHARNPGKKYEYHKKKYETIEGRARSMFNSARQRLPDDFLLTIEHVISCLSIGRCSVTGLPFDFSVNQNGKQRRSFSAFSPSLDRKNPRIGYTDDNTRVVIWQYNVMKGELSDSDVLAICRLIVARNSCDD